MLDIRDTRYGVDLFKASMERHVIRVPPWYSSEANRVAADRVAASLGAATICNHARMYDSKTEYPSSEESGEVSPFSI